MVQVWDSVEAGPLGERMIRFLDRYPKVDKIYVTSAMDGGHGAVSHHYGLSYKGSHTAAIDIGAKNAKQMRDIAKWLYDNFASLTVELIHTTPFSDDDGFYVKNQIRYPGGSIYGKATMNEHRNHVHWATSADLMTAIERMTEPPTVEEPAPAEKSVGTEKAMGIEAFDQEQLLAIVADLKRQVERLEGLIGRKP